jgi:hypothetical protein
VVPRVTHTLFLMYTPIRRGAKLLACRKLDFPWSQKMLARFESPRNTHYHAYNPTRKRGGYHMNIRSESKRRKKLNKVHNSPVKWRLADNPSALVGLEVVLPRGWICPGDGSEAVISQRACSGRA